MQVREAVIPNQAEPLEHPAPRWEKLEKDLMVLSFRISPCACLNAINPRLVAAFITAPMYLEWLGVKAFTFLRARLCDYNAFVYARQPPRCLLFSCALAGGVASGRWR